MSEFVEFFPGDVMALMEERRRKMPPSDRAWVERMADHIEQKLEEQTGENGPCQQP